MNDLTSPISTCNIQGMETNQIPPSQRKLIGGLNCKPATQVDDLHWELTNLCNELGFKIEPSSEGFELATIGNLIFNADVVDQFKCETQSFTEHILLVSSETDAGNYSAPRFMKNLRNAIRLLKSGEAITVACDEHNCDYCN